MSCYMHIKELLDAAPAQLPDNEPWADLSPYEKLVKENELLKLEIERLKGMK